MHVSAERGFVQFEANRASEQAFKVSFSPKYGSGCVDGGAWGGWFRGCIYLKFFRK